MASKTVGFRTLFENEMIRTTFPYCKDGDDMMYAHRKHGGGGMSKEVTRIMLVPISYTTFYRTITLGKPS